MESDTYGETTSTYKSIIIIVTTIKVRVNNGYENLTKSKIVAFIFVRSALGKAVEIIKLVTLMPLSSK